MRIRIVFPAALAGLVLAPAPAPAQSPTLEQVLKFRPAQKDVEIDVPAPDQLDKCKIEVERTTKTSGWVVLGPEGQILRRFVDTDGDNTVDQWRYYRHGLEVYRDIDSNKNNKIDQSRWLNTGGSRWGVDADEDGRIDSWKVLSAEEASREAVRALTQRDARALQALLIDAEDVRTLGLSKETGEKLLESVARPETRLQEVLAKSRSIGPGTNWMRFDSSSPGIVPADDGKASGDLFVYENAMAIVETGNKPGLVQLGEMVRVGNVWKLTQVPRPLEGEKVEITMGGVLMQPEIAAAAGGPAAVAITPKVQKILEDLQKHDANAPAPTAGPPALAAYNEKRADLLALLVEAVETDQEREQWTQQMVDGIATAVQTGAYPAGLVRLQQIEADAARRQPKSAIVPYATYRRLQAEYTVRLQAAQEDERAKVQEWWLAQLQAFAKEHSKSEVAAEALFQLAFTHEVAGQLEEALKWYAAVAAAHPEEDAGIRATGAMHRLDLNGKPLELAGAGLRGGNIDVRQLRGKVVLVVFWATWCKPCTEDLPRLRDAYEQHRGQGFEILGVNLDGTTDETDAYIRQHRVTWPHIHDPGGLQSAPARTFGIVSLPTMFLVDKEGKVVSRSVAADDLKTVLPEMLKK
ncbi:MAG: redoxin domain-containing protein [Planctomycetales bacterium]